jgi:hypothetical protein
MKPKHTVFYSWQSDLPKETNLVALRQALREAASQVENEIEDTRIDIDEATRDAPGSPNIPQMIFNKIGTCDIFVCDLTTINSATGDQRKVPNPNVLIELGFAIATVGWDRIILLFNKVYGNFPADLPFDIDRHRATVFNISDKKDHNGKKQIAAVLKEAIQVIIEKDPLTPNELKKVTPEQRKRENDIKKLHLALSAIHLPAFDHFLEDFPTKIPENIFDYKDLFVSVVDSNTFHIYDQELSHKITELKKSWIKALSYGDHYGPDSTGRYYNYYLPFDEFPNVRSERDFRFLTDYRVVLENDLRNLLNYVRQHYIEVDIDETSKNALEARK